MRIKILIWNQNWGSTYVVTHHYMYIPILASHLFVQICMKKIYLWKHEPTAASKWDSIKLERRQLAVQYKFVVFVGGSGEQYKVHIFWEGHKILRNLHLTFDCTLCCICLGRCCLGLETRVIIKISKKSLLSCKCGLIFIGMKQKKNFFFEK